uniref:Protein TIC 214 n=1 Tax=Pinus monophylla TaxID=151562 RepID=F0UX34_9CONI|nr:hypothetical chloroplast protein [Pinus monophylla]ADX94914.1 hypothetical chloroplast protein [Pinus monophylla]
MIRVLGLLWDPLSAWVEVSGPIILFGLYYGFIATLPFGPSKIYSIKSLFLGETLYGIIAISGSITGQLIVFLSMYYSPIYAALWKPHAITLLAIPYMFCRVFRSIEKPSSPESTHPMNSIKNPKILSLFMGGLILQLLNPTLNSVLRRLVNLFLFRYSDNISFMISSFCGWLGGHILFIIILTKLGSFRIERNSPIDYTSLRRYIHQTFSLLIISSFLCYLGRAPLPFYINRKKKNDKKEDRSVAMAKEDRSVAEDEDRSVAEDEDRSVAMAKEDRSVAEDEDRSVAEDEDRSVAEDEDRSVAEDEDRSVAMAKEDRSVAEDEDPEDEDRSVAMAKEDRSVAEDEDPEDEDHSVAEDEDRSAAREKKLQGLPKEEQLSWFKQPCPIMFFDPDRVYQPIRYIGNSPFNRLNPVRTEVSQYFFGAYSSDGKKRISFTLLPSVLALGEKLGKYRDLLDTSCLSEDPYHRWNHTMKRRRDSLGNEFSDRVKALSHGSPAENVIERRVKFSNSQGNSFTEMYDPLLNGALRGTIDQFESPKMLNDSIISIISNLSDFIEIPIKDRKEGFPNDQFGYGYHISEHWQKLEHKSFRLPWEPLPTHTFRSLVPSTKSSKREKVEPISKRLYPLAERIIPNKAKNIFEEYLSNIDSSFGKLIYPKDLLEIDFRVAYMDLAPEIASCNERIYTNYLVNIYNQIDGRNVAPTGTIKWELILSLFTTERIFLFESLAQHEWTILRNCRGNVSTDDSTQTKDFIDLYGEILLNEPLQFREIQKHLPRWSSGFMMGERVNDDIDTASIQISTNRIRTRKVKSTLTFHMGQDTIVLKRYHAESDYRRSLIRGSIRAKRRKIMIWKRVQPNVHSLFFLRRMEIPTYPKDYYDTFDSGRVNQEQIQKEVRDKIHRGKDLGPLHNMTPAENVCLVWPEMHYFRGVILVAQSNIRKNIILPSLIIAKNIGRILLFQASEFSKDWEEMREEIHIKCGSDGTEFSQKKFPDKWYKYGMQIKILFPFRLKPWHRSKLQSKKRMRGSYLTTLGFETDIPFGEPNPKLGIFSEFFQPIFKKVKKGLKRELILFKKVKRRLMGSTGIRRVPRVRYIDKSELNDRIQNKLLSKTETTPMGSANDSSEVNDQFGYETQTINVKDPDDWTTTMKERIESIAIINSSPITGMSLMDPEIHTGSKGSFNILGSTLKKRLVQIRRIPGRFRNKSVQLIRKRFYSMKLMKLFLKRMDRSLLLSVIHFIGSNIKFWIRSAWIRSTGNIATIYGRIFIINNYISKINRGKITNYYSINEKIQDFEIRPDQNMFSMSQAYVFHKIWQIGAIDRFYSKYFFKYRAQTSYPLIKKKIKELLDIQRILDHEKPQDLKENDWKQWLRCFDRYKLSPQIWSRINPQKWRNRVNKQCTCYEERFIPYEQKKDYIFATVIEPSLGLLRKMNKRYRYDLLSYSYLNSTKELDILNLTKDSDILNLTKEFDILNLTKDSDILNLTKDSDILKIEKRRDNVGIMDSPKIEKRRSGLDLKFWLFPELSGKENIYDNSKFIPEYSILSKAQERKEIKEKEREERIKVLEERIGIIRSDVQNKKVEDQKTGKVEEKQTGKVEEKQTGKVEEKQTGKVEDQKTGKVEQKQNGKVKQEQFGLKLKVERKKSGKVEQTQTGKIKQKPLGLNLKVKNIKTENIKTENIKTENIKTNNIKTENIKTINKKTIKKKTNKVIFQYKIIEAIGEENLSNLSRIGRIIAESENSAKFLRTQKENIDLNLMFLFIHKDINGYEKYINANDINANDINANDINANDINANDINANDINANDINANDINANDINAKDSNAKDSNAKDSNAKDSNAKDSNAKNSNADEILLDSPIVSPEPYRLSSIVNDNILIYKIVSMWLKSEKIKRAGLGDDKKILSSFNLEDILLPKRRREFRILNRFDLENDHVGFSNGKSIQNDEELMGRDQHLSVDTTQRIKRFLWPSYRLEDLLCMNRYWFNTNDGSRSAMLSIPFYPLNVNSVQDMFKIKPIRSFHFINVM